MSAAGHPIRVRHAARTRETHLAGGASLGPSSPVDDQEQIKGAGIAPGTVETAAFSPLAVIGNLTNGPADVVIDDDGVLIRNGKLTLEDEFSATVAVAGGFAGGWADFIRSGFYGADFRAGVPGVLVDGRGAQLPYWTVGRVGSPVLNLVDDAAFPAGRKIEAAFSALTDKPWITSDPVPATGGIPYCLTYTYAYAEPEGTSLTLAFKFDWLDASLTKIGGWNVYVGGSSTVPERVQIVTPFGSEPPGNTRYARLMIEFSEFIAHDAASRVYLGGVSLLPAIAGLDPALTARAEQAEFGAVFISGNYYKGGSGHGEMIIGADGNMWITDGNLNNVFSLTDRGTIEEFGGLGTGPNGRVVSQLTGNSAMYDPDLANKTVLLLEPTADRNIHGFAVGVPGWIRFLVNTGTADITLIHESASATIATARVACPNLVNLVVGPGEGVTLVYGGRPDGTGLRWRVVAFK